MKKLKTTTYYRKDDFLVTGKDTASTKSVERLIFLPISNTLGKARGGNAPGRGGLPPGRDPTKKDQRGMLERNGGEGKVFQWWFSLNFDKNVALHLVKGATTLKKNRPLHADPSRRKVRKGLLHNVAWLRALSNGRGSRKIKRAVLEERDRRIEGGV